MRMQRASVAAGLLALAAVVASAVISERIYERLPHIEDEFAILWQAHVMANGEISQETPPLANSFLVPFVVDHDGQRFGKYPPGWSAALSLGIRIGQPWLVQALLWGAVVWLTYRLGSRVVSPGAGFLAATLTLSSPMVLMLSGTWMSHGLSTFLALSFLLSMIDLLPAGEWIAMRSPVSRSLLILVAGMSLGLLILTRPLTAVGVALPGLVLCGVRFVRGIGRERSACLWVGLVTLLVGSMLLLWQWALSGDPFRNLYSLWWPYDRLGFGQGIGVTNSGHNLAWAFYNTRFSLRVGIHDLFGWPWLSWILLPFGLVELRKNRDGWLAFGVFPSLILVYGFYWVGSWLYGPRYYVESVPMLAVISAAGFGWLIGRPGSQRILQRVRVYIFSFILLLLIVFNGVFYVPTRLDGKRGLYGIRREAIQRLVQADLGRALVIVRADRWFEYARYLTLTDPFCVSDLLIAWSVSSKEDQRLIEVYGDRPVYLHQPERPGILILLEGS
jgi:4-amino-4-deoxy-L-arabinose transferase-like glycosyltransferase